MGKDYEQKTGLKSYLGEYKGLVPFAGGCLGSGAAYIAGATAGTLKAITTEIPYIVESNGYGITDKLSYVASESLNGGYDTAAKLGGLGFLAGLFLTVKFKKSVKDLIGR